MKFRLQVSDLNAALNVVTLVPPTVVTAQGISGYLFKLEGGKCSIHSRDEQRRIKVDVPATDVEGEGSFIYLADKIDSMRYLDGWIEFEAGLEDNRHWFKYQSEGGAKAERSTCDPDLMQSLDEDLKKTKEAFQLPVALLKEALTLTKDYIAKAADARLEDQYKTVQLFDAAAKKEWAKGDGCFFACDHVRMIYFSCNEFKGKGLAIHGKHIQCLLSFLGKCEGILTVHIGEGMTFLSDAKGQIVGWNDVHKHHGKYAYYPLKMDGFVLLLDKARLVRTLKFVRAELDSRRDKTRVEYSHEDTSLRFKASETSGQAESPPVRVDKLLVDEEKGFGAEASKEDFAANVNINHLIELIEPMKGHQVELRAASVKKGDREYVLFRTIEVFKIDEKGKVVISDKDQEGAVYQCEVTRFMPSKD